MTNKQFEEFKTSAHKVCILGDFDNRALQSIWEGVMIVEKEREKIKSRAIVAIAKKRKENPNYARVMIDGKQKQYYKKKGDKK